MMLFIKRVFEEGIEGCRRHVHFFASACLVVILTASFAGFLFLAKEIVEFLVEEAEARADVSVYLQKGLDEEDILLFKDKLSELEGVAAVEFKSEEQALIEFIAKHEYDQDLMDSLSEVGRNPFLASLSIRASGMSDYENIASYLNREEFQGMIEKVDYYQRRSVLEKIFELTRAVKETGVFLLAVFTTASALVTFNTVRLAIRERREEVRIMRLVGASDAFISAPFIIQGLAVGAVSFLIAFVVLALFSYLFTPKISALFEGFRIFSFFRGNILEIALVQLSAALILSVVPTFMAVRRYLKM